MISEKEFATGFSAFWTECLPFLNAYTVAQLNLSAHPLGHERGLMKPLPPVRGDNDLIAEAAFELFARSVSNKTDVLSLAVRADLLKEINNNALQRILGLRSYWKDKRRSLVSADDYIVELAKRLEEYFSLAERGQAIIVQPSFKGCGILDSCFGDIVAGDTIYEVKMVDRNLRSADLRQVLIYAALNRESRQYLLENVAILNPKRGVVYIYAIEDIATQISGKTAAEMLFQISDFVGRFESLHRPS